MTSEEVPARGFVHLHVHTEHSKQDGVIRVADLVTWAAGEGMPAVATTDHGNDAAAWKFAQACKAAGIKPIHGIEAYMALVPDGTHVDADQRDKTTGEHLNPVLAWDDPRVRFAQTARMQPDAETGKVKRNTNNHLTVLARTSTGWRNLTAMMNAAERSFYLKPLIDYALLRTHGSSTWDEETKSLVPGQPGDGGLIVLSGCLGGPVASEVAMARSVDEDGQVVWDEHYLDRARTALDHLIACVGVDNVYVEVMEHGLGAEGIDHVKMLMTLAREAGVRVVATNDAHYLGGCEHGPDENGHIAHDGCDADAHDSWLVSGENARRKGKGKAIRKDDPDRWRFNGAGYWLRTETEMRDLYSSKAWQAACDETVALAGRVEDDIIPFVPLRLPKFPVPADVVAEWETCDQAKYPTAADYLLHRNVVEGAKRLYADPQTGKITEEARERLAFEEKVIFDKGISDYFLIVADAIEWARSDRGLPTAEHPLGKPGEKKPILVGPGRGSAAGAAVSYCVGIVMVDPLRHHLLFERFLNPDRTGMPDIDVDFESARRDEIYDYVAARYGQRYVARIGAFQMAKSKRAIKDAARVLERVPLGDALAKTVPVHQGSPQPFKKLWNEENAEATEFRTLAAGDYDAGRVVRLAQAFEGVVAGEGIHAAGIIISDEPLDTLIPMRLQRKGAEILSEVPIALWDGVDIDAFGMLKLDALSIENLDYLAAAVDHIEARTGQRIDVAHFDVPDPDDLANPQVQAAWARLREGRTAGVFQLESGGMTELCVQVSPSRYDDLSALVALYRPGPMGSGEHVRYAERKNGRQEISYDHLTRDPAEREVIASVLDETYGSVVYQEQMMRLAGAVSGFTAGERDKLRKVISKKKSEDLDAMWDRFLEGGLSTTTPSGATKPAFAESTLRALWVTFKAAGEYAFNKAHSVAYGYLGFVTGLFTANYSVDYGAGVLGVTAKPGKRRAALTSLKADGIETLAPDVNRSGVDTAPDDQAVRLGLSEIRDVGKQSETIVAVRQAGGEFTSLADFVARTSGVPVSATEALIEAGAFDAIEPYTSRRAMMKAARAIGDVVVPIPEAAEWSALEKAARQRNRLGVSLGVHPVSHYAETLRTYRFADGTAIGRNSAQTLMPLRKVLDAERIDYAVTAGLLTAWEPRVTRKGGKMVTFTIETATQEFTGIAFDRGLATLDHTPRLGDIIAVAGAVQDKEVTMTSTDPETGEDVEETSIRREMVADRFEVIPVDADERPASAETQATREEAASSASRLADLSAHASQVATAIAARPRTRATATRAKGAALTAEPDQEPLPEPPAAEPDPYIGVGWLDVASGHYEPEQIQWLRGLAPTVEISEITGVLSVPVEGLRRDITRKGGKRWLVLLGSTRDQAQALAAEGETTGPSAGPAAGSLTAAEAS